MRVSVELSNWASQVAKTHLVEMELPDGSTYRDVIEKLAELHPDLVNLVIMPDRRSMMNANMFSKDGEEMIYEEQLDQCPEDGDKLILMSIIVGG